MQDLKNELATLRSINNLERSVDPTHQVLAKSNIEEEGDMKSVKEASPEFTHPNKYPQLHGVGDISSGVALLEQNTYTSCQKNIYSIKNGGRSTGKDRQILVVGAQLLEGHIDTIFSYEGS